VVQHARHARARGAAVACVLHHEEQARAVADAVLRLGPEWPDGWAAEGLPAA
jgi:alpha-D-ribose 1-methylphosphonate 5-triphosphate synthase subunit PhnL